MFTRLIKTRKRRPPRRRRDKCRPPRRRRVINARRVLAGHDDRAEILRKFTRTPRHGDGAETSSLTSYIVCVPKGLSAPVAITAKHELTLSFNTMCVQTRKTI